MDSVPKPKLYLEDLRVGQRFTTGRYLMEEKRIKEFAAEFDPQPFHLDEAAGAESIFQGLAASGWHTAAATMKLLVEGEMAIAGGLIGVGGEISWPKPTRKGDILQVESEVLEIIPSRSKPQRGLAKIRNTTVNQNGEVLQIFTVSVLVQRRGGG
jgi:acyl dehydratase